MGWMLLLPGLYVVPWPLMTGPAFGDDANVRIVNSDSASFTDAPKWNVACRLGNAIDCLRRGWCLLPLNTFTPTLCLGY